MFKDKTPEASTEMIFYLIGNEGEERLVLAESLERAIQIYYREHPELITDEVNALTICQFSELISVDQVSTN